MFFNTISNLETINLKKRYTPPKLYVPKTVKNGRKVPDVSAGARWYVYFRFRHPVSDKLVLKKYKKGLNHYKTAGERLHFGAKLVAAYTQLLESGFNPFVRSGFDIDSKAEHMTLVEAVDYALLSKQNEVKTTTYQSYTIKSKVFKRWANKNSISNMSISDFKFNHALGFINFIRNGQGLNKKPTPTTVNTYNTDLGTLFEKLKKDRIIKENFFKSIDTKRSAPKRHKSFSMEQLKEIKKHLLKHDKNLYHFIVILTYSFLRNREVLSLKVKDIDLKNGLLSIPTKNEQITFKLIHDKVEDILINELNIINSPKDHFIIHDEAGKTGLWNKSIDRKKRIMSDRFRAILNELGYKEEYTLYSFRHTITKDVFINLIRSGLTEREAIFKLMEISGHKTELALRKYLRDIGAIVPKSFDSYTTLDF